ncbi:uncharacterized protein METZ01_LOCUS256011 [marine metagenome]|uniref:Methylenetetrahydrofolate reductase (NAD(P)H) n=1 Tax=marine metagenome TaxID=408172 RepID=A0A382IVI0_9ZZZZ
MGTIAFETIPPLIKDGPQAEDESIKRIKDLLIRTNLYGRINSILIPHMIEEDGDRPLPFERRSDILNISSYWSRELQSSSIVTQVTPFSTVADLKQRLESLRDQGVKRCVYVGVPRVWNKQDVIGPYPDQALTIFNQIIPYAGCVLIPTRPDENIRFLSKIGNGADFALTQLLYSDYITTFLKSFGHESPKPEILLSFGYVPKIESRIGLIKWLIKDSSKLVKYEMDLVEKLANLPFKQKLSTLLDLYKRIIDGIIDLDFPIGIHFECPYGPSQPALETFNEMLDYWSPP